MALLYEAFFVARIAPGPDAASAPSATAAAAASSAGGPAAGSAAAKQRAALFCRYAPPGAAAVPSADNLAAFCFPLGVEAVKPSPYLVTCEFTFTLTGGDGGRLHGMARRTHDPTYRPPLPAPGGVRGQVQASDSRRLPQVLCILSRHCWQPFFSKVLEVADQLLAPHAGCAALPADSPAARFLASLPALMVSAGPPLPPLGAVLRAPLPPSPAPISVDRMRRALAPPGGQRGDPLLGLWPDAIELEVPPELGNGPVNAGISLARLLWFLTPRQAVTLVASLLLERRIILVARDADTVSAAVHAANALLYPFRWQHIYLPLLPLALKDYLAAPMPYLVGIQAECLPLLRGMALEEVVMIDLDRLGSCTPELGSPGDDYWALPFAAELEDVFEVVRDHIKSPTEFDSTPKCTELLQNFFLRLVGRYRQFVRRDEEVTFAALAIGLDRVGSSSSSRGGQGGSSGSKGGEEENPRAHGFVFDQGAFTASHRRKNRVVAFLKQFRNSQMLEVFITERLQLASEGYMTDDPFEVKVAERASRSAVRLGMAGVAAGGGAAAAAAKGRFGSLLRKAGSVVMQGSGSLVASIRHMGVSQQEEAHMLTGRTPSGANLSGLSPRAPGMGLARLSPGPMAAAGVAAGAPMHSRTNSVTNRPGSRTGSCNNLHRPSPNLASLNGGVPPSLEQLRPDMFFGLDDDDDDDDASSVASDASIEHSRPRGSPGPLEKAMGGGRSFGSLFHQAPPPGSRLPSSQHTASRLGTTESSEQLQQLESGSLAAAAASAAAAAAAAAFASGDSSTSAAHQTPLKPATARGIHVDALAGKRSRAAAAAAAAAGVAVGSPASLIDLTSPAREVALREQQHQQQGRAVQRSVSNSHSGWAIFEDVACFRSPVQRHDSSAAAATSASLLDDGMSPLGQALCSPLMRESSWSQQGLGSRSGQPQIYRELSLSPAQDRQQQQLLQQQQGARRRIEQQLSMVRQAQQAPAGWEQFGGGDQGAQPPLRQAIHSPLAQGLPTLRKLASLPRCGSSSASAGSPHRGSSSSSGGGVSLQPSRLSVTHDAFAEALLMGAAAAVGREHLPGAPSHCRTSSSTSVGTASPSGHHYPPHQHQQPYELGGGSTWRTSSSAWAEWTEAAAAPTAAAGQQQQQQQASLMRQLTSGCRSVSWGDWSGAWPPGSAGGSDAREQQAGAAADQLAAMRLYP